MNTIKVTKIRQWFLPVAAEDYKMLRSLGIPLIRIHENFMPTIKHFVARKKYKLQLVDFQEQIFQPYVDELGRRWQAKEHRKTLVTAQYLKFETSHASVLPGAKKAVPQLENSLRRFFQRWGFAHSLEVSESRGKLKLHCSYKHDSQKQPLIHLQDDVTSLPQIKLVLGFVKITLTLMQHEVETNISVAAGTQWTSIHTARCLYSQFSDVRPMITTLMEIVNKDPHNFDNK